MLVALDTSCIINLLSREETPQADLLAVLRHALAGRIRVTVTPIVDVEMRRGDSERMEPAEHRDFIRTSLAQFPVAVISPEREPERDAMASEFLELLWPNVQPSSRKFSNSLRDCKHLASLHLCGGNAFITLDDELARKAGRHSDRLGVAVLAPSVLRERLDHLFAPPPAPATSWMPTVRRAKPDDKGEIRKLLDPIRDTYDDFDAWLDKALDSKEIWVGLLDGPIGAVAVWAPKVGTETIKLSTFFVGEAYSGRGLGPYLLFHQLRLWVERRISKAFVTVSSARLEALGFFITYGFRIEGSAARRYKSGAVEFVLAKHLFYEVVDDAHLPAFLDTVGRQIFDLPDDDRVRSASSWFLPPRFGALQPAYNKESLVSIDVIDSVAQVLTSMPIGKFEEIVYPARLSSPTRSAYLIPIQPRWADSMMYVPREQSSLFIATDKLALRSDNAYYCSPVYLDAALDGSPALFYVSSPDKMIAGFARILLREIAEPEDLHLKFDRLGIYELGDIRAHIKPTGRFVGCAMAIRFAWWVPLERPIKLDQMRKKFHLEAPQRITAIGHDKYEAILKEGGIAW
jgi:predicted nucleic acid-binding protein/ribosomal protein S18 acetylase RimI-like enzyme